MKIFVTGFQRSGTTLLSSLIGKHPQVKKMWHEQLLALWYTKEELLRITQLKEKVSLEEDVFDYHNVDIDYDWLHDTWGDKMPYLLPFLIRGKNESIIDVMNIWLKWWGDETRIVHIIRHPWDVINSVHTGKINEVLRNGKYQCYLQMVPQVLNFLSSCNSLNIKYEDLTSRPKDILKTVYEYLSLDSSTKLIEEIVSQDQINFRKIEGSRAFNYRKRKTDNSAYPIKDMLPILKNIGESRYSEN